MDLNTYQSRAAETAAWPEGAGWDYLLSALPEEIGELSSIFAKAARKGQGRCLNPEQYTAAVKELGDVLWNVALIATELDVSLGHVAQTNLDKLADRNSRGTIIGAGDNR